MLRLVEERERRGEELVGALRHRHVTAALDQRDLCLRQRLMHIRQVAQRQHSYMVKARSADLLVEVGMELEMAWVTPVVDGSHNTKIGIGQPGRLDASAGVSKLEVPNGTVDRSISISYMLFSAGAPTRLRDTARPSQAKNGAAGSREARDETESRK